MHEHAHKIVYLKDYTPPDYLIGTVELHFDLHEEFATVRSFLTLHRNYDKAQQKRPLILDGRHLLLKKVLLDDRPLAEEEYKVDEESLTIFDVPDVFSLAIETEIKPQDNTTLEGLYRSGGMFCTQCEAEGFREITYFLDRPDVMSRYTTTIAADKAKYPVLLANGNLKTTSDLDGGRHSATWEDPFAKPCYLFAMVAGDLSRIADTFVTRSGRPVNLEIYVEHHNKDKCSHAMRSLKEAMRWDEVVFGLEYDLDQYMIVAVDDFNMGAMENKGLNVFNSKFVLAKPETATDTDYEGIEVVIAHEYFHNWTGNRVTCRDWFQLSLKEGLTVFRDQLFSADMISGATKRIHDANLLRTVQFAEDGGPMAHPIQPDSYIEINNFYTVTVYEKGAEVIRMIHTLLGAELFKKGLTLYLSRHDGQAVTNEDFVRCMEDAAGVDLSQFRLWYTQAGTPELNVTGSYDAGEATYTLTVRQSCPPTPGQPEKKPLHIPVSIGLVGRDGRDLPLRLEGESGGTAAVNRILEVREPVHTFQFVDVADEPVPSLLRGFSAPVKLTFEYSDADLMFLLAHDSDPFNRWEAGQRLACRIMLSMVDDVRNSRPLKLGDSFGKVIGDILADQTIADKAFTAQLVTLPSEDYLAEQMAVIDVDAIHTARQFVRRQLAAQLQDRWQAVYRDNQSLEPYRYDPRLAAQRRLKNTALSYLMALDEEQVRQLCLQQFYKADNMTNAVNALRFLTHADSPEKYEALAAFAERWQGDPLVMDKWFAIQASAPIPGTLDVVQVLMDHPAFSIRNPNRVRALIGSFCGGNPVCFHEVDGAGYRFLAEQVLRLHKANPQIAARLVGRLSRWRRFDEHRQQLMREQLERIMAEPQLSRDVYEVVSKSLKAPSAPAEGR